MIIKQSLLFLKRLLNPSPLGEGTPTGWVRLFSLLLFSVAFSLDQGGNEVDFLESGLGSRPLAMGNAYTAAGNDVNTIQYNPAGMVFARGFELTSMQAKLASGFDLYYLGILTQQREYNVQTVPDSAWGISWVNGSLADIPLVTVNEGVTVNTDIKPSSYSTYQANALTLAYASWLMPDLAWGVSTTGFYKNFLHVDGGQGYGATLTPGLMWRLKHNVILGLVVKDMLNMQHWDTGTTEQVHPEIRLGVCFEVFDDLLLSVEARQKMDNRYQPTFHAGTEWSLLHYIRLRAGFSEDRFSAGCGIYLTHLSIQYAYMGDISDGIGDSHRVSLEVGL